MEIGRKLLEPVYISGHAGSGEQVANHPVHIVEIERLGQHLASIELTDRIQHMSPVVTGNEKALD